MASNVCDISIELHFGQKTSHQLPRSPIAYRNKITSPLTYKSEREGKMSSVGLFTYLVMQLGIMLPKPILLKFGMAVGKANGDKHSSR